MKNSFTGAALSEKQKINDKYAVNNKIRTSKKIKDQFAKSVCKKLTALVYHLP